MVDAGWRVGADLLNEVGTSDEHLIGPGSPNHLGIRRFPYRGKDPCPCPVRQLHGTLPNRPRASLHENGLAGDRPRDMHGTVARDAGNAEACPLLERDSGRERDSLDGRNGDVLGCRPERAGALRAEAPHPLAHPRRRDALADAIDRARPVAVGYYPRKRHPNVKSVLALLHVAGIDAGSGYADAYLARFRLRVRHFPDDEHLGSRALFSYQAASISKLGVTRDKAV